MFLVVVIKNYGCQYCSVKWVLCKVQYFGRLMIEFQLYFTWISGYLTILKYIKCLQYLHLNTMVARQTNKT